MNNRFSILLALLVLMALSAVGCTSKDPAAVGLYAPGVEVKDALTGQTLSTADLKGKVLLVNFWASWCPPCREEMPSIEALYRELKDRPDFRMVTILYNDSNQNGIGYMKQNGYTFPVYEDIGGSTARKYGITGVPETYLVDKKGLMKRKIIGAIDWNSPEEKASLLALFNQ